MQRLAVTDVVLTVGAEVATVITVSGQVLTELGREATVPVSLRWYLATDSAGLTPATAAPDGVAAGTDGALIEYAANLSGEVVTEADGDFDIAITEAASSSLYLVIVLPDGSLRVSDVIEHAGA